MKSNSVEITELDESPYLEKLVDVFDGVVDFFFSMSELQAISGQDSLDQLEVYVEAQVDDPYYSEPINASYITTLYDPRIKLKFLSQQPRAFKPRMPYVTHIAVQQQDGTPLPFEKLFNSFIKITVEMVGTSSYSNQTYMPIGPSCIVAYQFTPDAKTQFITLKATFVQNGVEDPNSLIVERGISYRSPSNSYIFVTSSTSQPAVGDYMIFTVKVSQQVDFVFYHIISASRIVFTDLLQMTSKQKTFDVGIRREMAPSAHIVAYYIRNDGEIVADSYNFHVDTSSIQNQVNLTINRRKDFTGKQKLI